MRAQETGRGLSVGAGRAAAPPQCTVGAMGPSVQPGPSLAGGPRLSHTRGPDRGIQPFALRSSSSVLAWGASPGLARTWVLYGGRLALVLAKLTGWPFATRTGTVYHFAFTRQLRCCRRRTCAQQRGWGAHVAFGSLTRRSTRSPEVLLRGGDEYVSNFSPLAGVFNKNTSISSEEH